MLKHFLIPRAPVSFHDTSFYQGCVNILVKVTPGFLNQGDKSLFKSSWSLTVSNPSTVKIDYTVKHSMLPFL
jgi:hypothetical protein